MPIFSPKELGALIGLEEGLAGRAAKRMTGAELDTKGLASADELHGGVKVISEPLSNYWQTFASLYLPSFLRTLVGSPLEQTDDAYHMLERYFWWTTPTVASPAFARFVRLYPQTSFDLYVCLVDLISSINPEMLSVAFSSPERPKFFQATLRCWTVIFARICFNTTEPFQIPKLPTSTTVRLRRLFVVMASCLPADDPGVLGFRNLLPRFVTGYKINTGPYNIEKNLKFWTWWCCEACRGESDSLVASTVASCAKRTDAEMDMCGGCESVRYCGRAHQKADWKRHKAVCMKPTW